MNEHDNKVFHWVVKQGSITLFADNENIHLEINTEDHPACLLTRSDAEEVIGILTDIAGNIWHNPDYTREPYQGPLYRLDENGKTYWDINGTRLIIGLNDQLDALEINAQGDPVMKVPVNFSVEIIQIMAHFLNKL